jgi:serine/threonine protein kinase
LVVSLAARCNFVFEVFFRQTNETIQSIGKGGFSSVWTAEDRVTGDLVVVKGLNLKLTFRFNTAQELTFIQVNLKLSFGFLAAKELTCSKKVIKIKKLNLKYILQELLMHKTCVHPNIVSFFDSYFVPDKKVSLSFFSCVNLR